MIQAVTRPLGRPLEHTSFPYTIGTLGTKVKEVLPFLHDVNDRLKEISTVTQHLTDLAHRQQELTSQQAGAGHLQAEAATQMSETVNALQDSYADFDDFWRPLRKHCFDISASRCADCSMRPTSSTGWPKGWRKTCRPRSSRTASPRNWCKSSKKTPPSSTT